MLQLKIQIQHLLKLNRRQILQKHEKLKHSNTTLVKVKFNRPALLQRRISIQIQHLLKLNSLHVGKNMAAIYSNTTLVKVKSAADYSPPPTLVIQIQHLLKLNGAGWQC